MRFECPIYLIGLVLVPVLVLLFTYVIRWKKQTAAGIGDAHLIQRLIQTYSPKRFQYKFLLLITALVFMVVGMANIQQVASKQTISRSGIDIIVALDVSNSMLTKDVQPDRLQRAKLLVNELMKKRTDDRFGLIVFAGHAYLQMPLSTDFPALSMYVQSADPRQVPTQGTVLAEALKSAQMAFDKKDKKFKAIVLISDGENHESEAVQAAIRLKEEGIVLFTIGVGTTAGEILTDAETQKPKRNKEGIPVVSKLNETLLTELANQNGGNYYFLTDVEAVADQISLAMNGLGKKDIQDKSQFQYRSYFQLFLGIAFLFLIIEFFISERSSHA